MFWEKTLFRKKYEYILAIIHISTGAVRKAHDYAIPSKKPAIAGFFCQCRPKVLWISFIQPLKTQV